MIYSRSLYWVKIKSWCAQKLIIILLRKTVCRIHITTAYCDWCSQPTVLFITLTICPHFLVQVTDLNFVMSLHCWISETISVSANAIISITLPGSHQRQESAGISCSPKMSDPNVANMTTSAWDLSFYSPFSECHHGGVQWRQEPRRAA